MKLKIVFIVLLAATIAIADDAKPAKYQPNEVQSLRLQVKLRDAQIAQRDLQTAQQRFNQTLFDLNAEADKVRTENKWSDKVSFDPNTLTFSEPVDSPAAKAPVSPTDKK
jgi:hypothetical protein